MRFLISAELSTLSPEVNAMRSKELKALLKGHGLNPKQAFGRYKGIDEVSYLIEASPEHASRAHSLIQGLANDYGQESILALQGTSGVIQTPQGETLARLTVVQESLETERPSTDHTAVKVGSQWLILRLA